MRPDGESGRLDYACRWARCAGTTPAAAGGITQAVYGLAPDLIEYGWGPVRMRGFGAKQD